MSLQDWLREWDYSSVVLPDESADLQRCSTIHLPGKQQGDSSRRVFRTPELLSQILEHLSVLEFANVQRAHPDILNVAQLFPALRRRFFLEADPTKRGTDSVINPYFEELARLRGFRLTCTTLDLREGKIARTIYYDKKDSRARPVKYLKPWRKNLASGMILSQPPVRVALHDQSFYAFSDCRLYKEGLDPPSAGFVYDAVKLLGEEARMHEQRHRNGLCCRY